MVKATVISGLLALVLICFGLIVFAWLYSQQGSSKPIKVDGSSLILHRGNGHKKGKKLVVTGADTEQRIRILSQGISFNAKEMPFMSWTFSQLAPRSGVWVGWINSENPQKLNMMPAILPYDSTAVYRMIDHPEWKGTILAVGFGFDNQMYESFVVDSIEFRPYSIKSMLESIVDEWTAFKPWSQRSINEIIIGSNQSLIHYPIIIFIWLVLSLIIIRAGRHGVQKKNIIIECLVICIFSWLLIDVVWQINLLRQNRLSWALYAGKLLKEKIKASVDRELYEFSQEINECRDKNQLKAVIISNTLDYKSYKPLKLEYLLLPEIPETRYVIGEVDKACYVVLNTDNTEMKKEGVYIDPLVKNFNKILEKVEHINPAKIGTIYFVGDKS